jgi:hypothetical protein
MVIWKIWGMQMALFYPHYLVSCPRSGHAHPNLRNLGLVCRAWSCVNTTPRPAVIARMGNDDLDG